MADNLLLAAIDTDTDVLDLDLSDEDALLAADRAEYDVDGVRALLAAINLQPIGAPSTACRRGEIMDLAVFRATGSRSLARIFGSAR